ncbi:acetyltransferase [Marinobacter algicola]|uniref:Pilin glycosylation protein n=1 Tax=Marinobacter algicola DG893 TaxID=443152 RepID=A6F1H5_9GAMM|nr:acetyltransferase [Marinobacter algicola]EDM47376.1 pilin glycosylation protein [Marinobacter algicola DG893]
MKCLAILGASGHGKVVAEAAECSGWDGIRFFDDAWPELTSNSRWPVVGSTAELLNNLEKYHGVVVGIGDNRIRYRKLQDLSAAGANIVSVIHPSATVSSYVKLELGSVVFANAVINADTMVGSGAIINTGAVIEHDCRLGTCIHVSPNATLAGGVVLGRLVWVGANACVRQLVSLGDEAVVGMGSVVLQNVVAGQVVAGNPAKPL